MGISVYQIDGVSSIPHTGKPWMVILPCVIRFNSLIGILHVNLFKAYRQQRMYFLIAGISLACAVALYLLAATLFGTLASIAITAVISSLLWYLLNEFALRRFVSMDAREIARWLLVSECMPGHSLWHLCSSLGVGVQSNLSKEGTMRKEGFIEIKK